MPELYYLVAVPLGPCILHVLAGFALAAPAATGRRGWYAIAYLATLAVELFQWTFSAGDPQMKDLVCGWSGTGAALVLIELNRARTLALALRRNLD